MPTAASSLRGKTAGTSGTARCKMSTRNGSIPRVPRSGAQWARDRYWPSYQSMPKLLPTADGGTYLAWSADDGVWVQRVTGDGMPAWGGPLHVGDSNAGTLVSLLPDQRGGAFVGMSSSRLQRLSSTGTLLLGSGGASPVTGASFEAGVEDGSGGTYWLLRTPDRNYHVTHVDSVGASSWSSPVTVGTGFVRYYEATIISDGEGERSPSGSTRAAADRRSMRPDSTLLDTNSGVSMDSRCM